MAKTKFNVVGKPVIRQDGYEKVTGQAKFADDFTFPDQLYGVMVRVDVVHARIHSIDFSGIKDNPALTTIVIADENTEDLYCGVGGFLKKGTPDEVATQAAVSGRFERERRDQPR